MPSDRTRAAIALPQRYFPVTAFAKDNRSGVAMINEPKTAVVVPWPLVLLHARRRTEMADSSAARRARRRARFTDLLRRR
jgi:hypothetical protein